MARLRGVRIARIAPFLISVALAAACTPARPSPSPSVAPPGATPRLPTPVPTVPVTPAPTGTPEPLPTGLVVRLTSCSHTCGPTPGTTVLDDGRIIWEDLENRATESRLTPEALQQVIDALAVPELDADGDYQAELRPGAEPVGRGATLFRLEVLRGDRRVVVTFGDPESYADEPDLWVIPPEMAILAGIANELRDPVAWLGQASFAEDPHAYEPDRYAGPDRPASRRSATTSGSMSTSTTSSGRSADRSRASASRSTRPAGSARAASLSPPRSRRRRSAPRRPRAPTGSGASG